MAYNRNEKCWRGKCSERIRPLKQSKKNVIVKRKISLNALNAQSRISKRRRTFFSTTRWRPART